MSAFPAEDDMRIYIGPNWGKYRSLWSEMKSAPSLKASASLAAAVFNSLWLLYRKQYWVGAAILAAQLAMTYQDEVWATMFDVAVAVFLGRYGKSVVLMGGAAAIAGVRSAGLSPEIAAIRLIRAGGISVIAPIVGALILFGVYVTTFTGFAADSGFGLDDLRVLRALIGQF
jgi:hypothetical protein